MRRNAHATLSLIRNAVISVSWAWAQWPWAERGKREAQIRRVQQKKKPFRDLCLKTQQSREGGGNNTFPWLLTLKCSARMEGLDFNWRRCTCVAVQSCTSVCAWAIPLPADTHLDWALPRAWAVGSAHVWAADLLQSAWEPLWVMGTR